MSLGTRLTLKTAVLILAVVVVAVVALLGLSGLNRDLDQALGEYDRLRAVYLLSTSAKQTQLALRSPPVDPDRARQMILQLVLLADQIEEMTKADRLRELRGSLREILAGLDEPPEGTDPYRLASVQLHGPIAYLSAEISETNTKILEIQKYAQAHRFRVQMSITGTALVAALLAIAVGVWQYMAVMNPLRRLGRGVRLLALGQFGSELKATGDREFVALSDDFNRMANELQTLYRDLEDKVRLRSAQLAQSERLASVGFLAAGVAHEINNPLAIIAGEAELALGDLPEDAQDRRAALTAIRDEAFRCKGITQKLLSLARPGSSTPEPTALKPIAQEVSSLVKTLPQKDRRLLAVEGDDQIVANTSASQVKQVLLNLVINALEAVEPDTGRVLVKVSSEDGRATILVQDNGRGIDEPTLSRVFEPFYTEKETPTTPGLGLGLSMSYAIIEELGGRLRAASDGPGKGSTFMIELPLIDGDSPQ